MITDIIQTAIISFDGMEFRTLESCPFCGGSVQGYDTRTKRFIVIQDGSGERTITVRVKRFTCRSCHRLINADEPFYPDTRIGSLVVDLYFTLASIMPPSRAARVLEAMGIIVDRTTWRKYLREKFPEIPATDIFGMRLPNSVITIADAAARISSAGGHADSADVLEVCRHPSSRRKIIQKDSASIADVPAVSGAAEGFSPDESPWQVPYGKLVPVIQETCTGDKQGLPAAEFSTGSGHHPF